MIFFCFNGFPSDLKINPSHSSTITCSHDQSSTHCLIFCYLLSHLFCSSHAVLLADPQGSTHAPASGSLHLLFLQPETLFPQHLPDCLSHFGQGQISPSYRGHPCPDYINLPLSTYFIFYSMYFLCVFSSLMCIQSGRRLGLSCSLTCSSHPVPDASRISVQVYWINKWINKYVGLMFIVYEIWW